MDNKTLSYNGSGWNSFWSFIPDAMLGMNDSFFSFKGGNLFKHNVNQTRNNFYGTQYKSMIKTVFNASPSENKLFKTISLEGTDSWDVLLSSDIQDTGHILSQWFEKKEGVFFAFVRNSGTTPADSDEYPLRSVNGIGRSVSFTGTTTKTINFAISPSLVDIGSILSVGDSLYFADPPTFSTIKYGGIVTGIVRDYVNNHNYITVNTNVGQAQAITQQNAFYMFVKNAVAESHGILGHYGIIELENDSTSEVQLFTVNSEVMKSNP